MTGGELLNLPSAASSMAAQRRYMASLAVLPGGGSPRRPPRRRARASRRLPGSRRRSSNIPLGASPFLMRPPRQRLRRDRPSPAGSRGASLAPAGVSQRQPPGADRAPTGQGRARRERLQSRPRWSRATRRRSSSTRGGAETQPSRSRRSRSRAVRAGPTRRAGAPAPSPGSLGKIGDDQARSGRRGRRAHVGGEVAERRVLLVADRGDHRHGAAGERATTDSSLNGRRSSKLPPPRVRITTSTAGCAATRLSAAAMRAPADAPWTRVSAIRCAPPGTAPGSRRSRRRARLRRRR